MKTVDSAIRRLSAGIPESMGNDRRVLPISSSFATQVGIVPILSRKSLTPPRDR